MLGKEYRSFSSSLCNFLHSPVISALLGPNTLLNTLFSNTLTSWHTAVGNLTACNKYSYGCENWSLTLREERRLRVFENRVLRRVFGAKRDEVTGEWRKLHNKQLHDLYF
jgi:hypothetical protein